MKTEKSNITYINEQKHYRETGMVCRKFMKRDNEHKKFIAEGESKLNNIH